MDTNIPTYINLQDPIVSATVPDIKQMPRPVATAERIQTVDLIRGFALLGILLMNIPVFGIDGSIYNIVLAGPHNNADFRTMQVVYSIFDGTMRGLFSMLFGAGMILFTMNKTESPGGITVAEYYYRRLGWLVVFGLINAFVFLWEGDILFYYGLCGMLLYPFRKSKPKWLLLLGFLCIGIGAFKSMLNYDNLRTSRSYYVSALAADKEHRKLNQKEEEAKARWTRIAESRKTDTAAVNKNVATMHSGYTTIFSDFIQRNGDNETLGMYHSCWDMLSMMFIGMGLFVLGFFSNKLSTSTYLMALVVGYGIGIPLGLIYFDYAYVDSINLGSYVDHYSTPHWILYDFRRMFLAVGHASLLMLVFRSRILPWLMKALSNVGQMAFTNYLMQSLICTFFFFGYGFGYYNKLSFHQLYYFVGAVWIFQLIFSSIWLRYFKFGPFEWLWRSLTYWKKQPMRKVQ